MAAALIANAGCLSTKVCAQGGVKAAIDRGLIF